MSDYHISVVVPVHNEPLTVGNVVAQLKTHLTTFTVGWEIILVDDASDTPLQQPAGSGEKGIRVITSLVRSGSGHARRIGSRQAGGEFVAWIDADGTYDAADLVHLVAAMGDSDQIVGARATDFGRLRLLRRIVKSATCRAVSRLWRTNIPDLNSGLRVFRRAALMEILEELPSGFSCTSTATLAALNRGQTVRFMPIDYRARETGAMSKFHPVWDTLRLWRVIYRQYRRRGRSCAVDASNGQISA